MTDVAEEMSLHMAGQKDPSLFLLQVRKRMASVLADEKITCRSLPESVQNELAPKLSF